MVGRILGAVGMVTLVVVPFAFFAVGGRWNTLFTVQVVVGLVFLATFAWTNLGELGDLATGRGTFFVVFSAVSTLLLVALVVAGNYLAVKANVKVDLTRGRLFTLAPDSVQTAANLDAEVNFLAFYPANDPHYRVLEELLTLYTQHTDLIRVQAIDPAKEPQLVEQYKINLAGNRVVVRAGDREEKIDDITEEAITNALIRLRHGTAKRVYFTTGHGESDFEDDQTERGLDLIRIAMDNEGLEAVKLSVLEIIDVPDNAAAVVVAGPQAPFLPQEVEILERYLAEGGRVLILLDPGIDAGLGPWLERFGIEANDDLVLDQNRMGQLLGTGPAVPLVRKYALHPITAGFDLAVLMPTARSLTVLQPALGERPMALCLSSETAWGESRYLEPPLGYDQGERRGPMPLGIVATRQVPDGTRSTEARLVVFGDADFAGRRWAKELGNADLFLNSLNWLAEQVDRITIRVKRRSASRLFLTERQAMFLRMFSVNLLPLSLAALGLGVWIVRRNR